MCGRSVGGATAGAALSSTSPVHLKTIMQILGLKKNGGMLFASTNSFGVIQADAKPVTLQGLGVLDLTSGRGPLRISANGETVQVNSWDPRHTYRFALSRRQIDVDPPADASLLAPSTEASGLSVTNWDNSTAPAVNGTPLKLEPYEHSRSLAFVPGHGAFRAREPTGRCGCSIVMGMRSGRPVPSLA